MDEIQKVNAVCFFLIGQLLETEAETMTIKQENVTKEGKLLGSFEIVVRKLEVEKEEECQCECHFISVTGCECNCNK